MTADIDGYGPRSGATEIDRLLEDCRTLSASGVERIASSWAKDTEGPGPDAWHDAEHAALLELERSNHVGEWDEVRKRILDLTEHHDALVAWRAEHGPVAHRAEDAVLGAALALLGRPGLDRGHERTLLHPLSETMPWLAELASG